ncbi:hypothetical protein [Actinomycetospora sp. TBRC 11914]|uniref:hypothetical protein n=1 Tax=Actinomycetospora sp. TBRC 11914 TaxID=2729387 RepID=UPI00145C9D05|nr:hypothetical protein [Actinomycetospora sp. TBRC 11914]NMO93703.1 hypothetical protein [Actinomycetospora sp. TBRC 11914]
MSAGGQHVRTRKPSRLVSAVLALIVVAGAAVLLSGAAAPAQPYRSEPTYPITTQLPFFPGSYVGLPYPVARETRAQSAAYVYEVSSNYPVSGLDYIASNGDLERLGTLAGSAVTAPWSLRVEPEPNGKAQRVSAYSGSDKGDTWITCTLRDASGAVVQTATDRGAQVQCSAWSN